MAKINVLKHSVVIRGKSFEDCKSEYDRIRIGVKKDFDVESDMEKLVFSDMIIREGECVAVFRVST